MHGITRSCSSLLLLTAFSPYAHAWLDGLSNNPTHAAIQLLALLLVSTALVWIPILLIFIVLLIWFKGRNKKTLVCYTELMQLRTIWQAISCQFIFPKEKIEKTGNIKYCRSFHHHPREEIVSSSAYLDAGATAFVVAAGVAFKSFLPCLTCFSCLPVAVATVATDLFSVPIVCATAGTTDGVAVVTTALACGAAAGVTGATGATAVAAVVVVCSGAAVVATVVLATAVLVFVAATDAVLTAVVAGALTVVLLTPVAGVTVAGVWANALPMATVLAIKAAIILFMFISCLM